jgi:hypothetical protein
VPLLHILPALQRRRTVPFLCPLSEIVPSTSISQTIEVIYSRRID